MAHDLSFQNAQQVMAAALAEAETLDLRVAVAVVDAAGHPVLSARVDGASFLNAALALSKATTAAGLGVSTAEVISQLTQAPAAVVAGMAAQHGVTPVFGGEPLLRDGRVIGAIGVSGLAAQDVPVAVAGARGLDA